MRIPSGFGGVGPLGGLSAKSGAGAAGAGAKAGGGDAANPFTTDSFTPAAGSPAAAAGQAQGEAAQLGELQAQFGRGMSDILLGSMMSAAWKKLMEMFNANLKN